jgi:hypothetical protein
VKTCEEAWRYLSFVTVKESFRIPLRVRRITRITFGWIGATMTLASVVRKPDRWCSPSRGLAFGAAPGCPDAGEAQQRQALEAGEPCRRLAGLRGNLGGNRETGAAVHSRSPPFASNTGGPPLSELIGEATIGPATRPATHNEKTPPGRAGLKAAMNSENIANPE